MSSTPERVEGARKVLKTNVQMGLLLVFLAGMISGNCMLLLKCIKQWNWENAWLVFSFVSLVAAPLILAAFTVPNFIGVYTHVTLGELLTPLLFGAGWGVAQVLFGISIVRLGMALTFAVVMGLGALFGTLVPILVQRRDVLATAQGSTLITGSVVMILGVLVSSYAGRSREAHGALGEGTLNNRGNRSSNYAKNISVAVLSGVLAAMMNYALVFGEGIAQQAVREGAEVADATYAVWPVALAGGLIPNLAYSLFLLNKKASWSKYSSLSPDLGYSVIMGVLWMAGLAMYGKATRYLGALGTSTGWALYYIFIILAANTAGFVSGEWRHAPKSQILALWAGLGLLITAILLIANSSK